MTSVPVSRHEPRSVAMGLTLAKVQAIAVWLMFGLSFFVFIEPAPTDFMFVIALLLHLRSGLTVSAMVIPLFLYLLTYNVGGFLSYLQVMYEPKTTMFVIITVYMSLSGVFLAFLVADNPLRNMAVIRNGWITGAFVAALLGLLGYFDVAGLQPVFAPSVRAQSAFKDPNVLSTYLILPAILLMQSFMLGIQKHRLLSLTALFTILACWFLAFSRGAWVNLVAASFLVVLITFILTPSAALRQRIVILSVIGLAAALLLVAVLLSSPAISALFSERLVLLQYYDAGEKGRFGNQLNAIPVLLQRPFGFGPLQFVKYFGQDPHNAFLNGFATFGWLGGVSYALLVFSTLIVGIRGMLVRTPWQHLSIAVFCVMFTTIMQGIQIDLEHWRHFHWMLGITWGLFAASMAYVPPQRRERVAG